MDMLNVLSKAVFDGTVTQYEYRTHYPFSPTTYSPSDEVRITIQQEDSLTHPCNSYIHVKGKVTKADGETFDKTLHFVNNAIAFLINEIRFEISNVVVDKTKNVGITSTIRNMLTLRPSMEITPNNAGWIGLGNTKAVKDFSYCIPLNMLMGFFEDYRSVIVNQKLDLVLMLSASQKDALYQANADPGSSDYKITIDSITWRVPHVQVNDDVKIGLLQTLDRNEILELPFRTWELHTYPELPTTNKTSWTIKTTTHLEKPRYVIVAFQTQRKNKLDKDASVFDKCDVTEVKLFLNSHYYPYDNIHGSNTLLYEMYARFQQSYYDRKEEPLMSILDFNVNPLFVIDCSKTPENIKSGPVDVRLDIETATPFPKETTAYCLILNESLVEYSALTGLVNRVE